MSSPLSDWQTKPTVRLGIATDHGGFDDKAVLLRHLANRHDLEVVDVGPHALDPLDDYPEYAAELARQIADGALDAGILLCRSGIGMSITANRFPGVYAALVTNEKGAKLSRTHNAANVLVIGSENVENTEITAIVDTWLDTPFSQEQRHVRRVRELDELADEWRREKPRAAPRE